MPKKLGECKCPIPVCGKPDAEVMEGEKGVPYIRCDHCGTMIRTMTRGVKDWMRSLVKKDDAAPAPAKDAPPAAKPAPAKGAKDDAPAPAKKKGALSFLTGGS